MSGVTSSAQIPFTKTVRAIREIPPVDTPSNNPVSTKAKSVTTDAAETRKTFVIGLPRTLSFPEPKNATA